MCNVPYSHSILFPCSADVQQYNVGLSLSSRRRRQSTSGQTQTIQEVGYGFQTRHEVHILLIK